MASSSGQTSHGGQLLGGRGLCLQGPFAAPWGKQAYYHRRGISKHVQKKGGSGKGGFSGGGYVWGGYEGEGSLRRTLSLG